MWQFSSANLIHFGRGSRALLPRELARSQCLRPLVVTDYNLVQLQIVQQILDTLRNDYHVSVFAEGCAEPAIEVAQAAIDYGRENHCDSVIGIGGGSNLDVAKITACCLQHKGAPQDYFGFDRIPGPVLPVFAMPSTAGTGSEVSHSAVLTATQNRVKVSTLSQWLRPTCAIVDPALTDSCPAKITGESGIDALVHAIEACTNKCFTQMVDVDPQARAYEGSYSLTKMLAAEAIRLVGKSLIAACKTGNAEARDDMALAATLAGMAFSNSGVGIVHALEYPIGALTHCGHGEGNGLLLPHVMRFNFEARLEQFADIAAWLGADTTALNQRDAAEAAIRQVETLQLETGIRTRLSQLGMKAGDIPQVAAKAFEIKRLMDLNARVPSRDDLVQILENAL